MKLYAAWAREKGERQLVLESSRRRQEEKYIALQRERGLAGYIRADF